MKSRKTMMANYEIYRPQSILQCLTDAPESPFNRKFQISQNSKYAFRVIVQFSEYKKIKILKCVKLKQQVVSSEVLVTAIHVM